MGEMGGAEQVTLSQAQLPSHTHAVSASAVIANTDDPTNNFLSAQPGMNGYTSGLNANATMHPSAISNAAGGGQPHNNIQPSLVLNYVIALEGIYPSRN